MPESDKTRTVFFIDGNNLYKTLIRMDLRLKPADHIKLITFICNGFRQVHGIEMRFVKAIYYNSVPSIKDSKEMYAKHIKFMQEMGKLPKFQVVARKLQMSSKKEVLSERIKILEKLGLCEKCKPNVMKNCLDCLWSIEKKEKGVDVKLAIDMIKGAFENEFDFSVLISGDADFIPALELVRALGKLPLSSFILCKSYALNLRNNFKHFFIKTEDIVSMIS